ncbi:hypothetical protein P9869_36190 [Streptomyces ossamyceticus]|nr:hypothetical protein [Streptomyces ossamyceticus]
MPRVAVEEQRGVPAALAGQWLEHRAGEGLAAQPPGAGDGGPADVDAGYGPPAGGEFGDQPPRPAPHAEDGAVAPLQGLEVHLVGAGAPPFHLQGQRCPCPLIGR